MFSAATVSALNQKIGDFATQTGKEVVVVTTPSLGGKTPQDAAERAFAQNQVNGVMIFLAKAEKVDGIVPDRAAARFFPAGQTQSIRQAMRGYFRSGDYDQGITTGVDLVLGEYRSHLGSVRRTSEAPLGTTVPTTSTARTGGFSMGWIWLILIALAIFLIVRALFRAIAGPRMYPPGYGGGPGYGPGMGGPGMGMGGMGMGYGGGGGSFWSGLLGGLGGAFIGNELFGRGGGFGGGFGGDSGAMQGGVDPSQSLDSQGWQSDAGQADMGNASFGDFGDSGGGFDAGGGGGFDSGGGGGW
jgi:uncharacterized membrane protein YgcG